MDDIFFTIGHQNQPISDADFDYALLGAAEVELPKSFSVEIPFYLNQKKIDACAGMGAATAKSIQDGVQLSPRILWGLAKKADDYIYWGTSFQQIMKQLQTIGALPYGTIDESTDVDREQYMRFELTPEQLEEAKKYRGLSYWRPRSSELTKQALYEQRIPLVVYCDWWTSYNYPVDGWLPKPTGKMVGGHLFVRKGWDVDAQGREYTKFRNSWSKNWGKDGDFYIYTDELYSYGIGSSYVIVDMPVEQAKIINAYDGKLVKNADKSDTYFVKAGKIIAIQNEPMFNLGRAAGFWGDWKDIITIEQVIKPDYVIKLV